jgi:membrane protease YdiL (CAAX protease family)
MIIMLFTGVTGEELGWRGFLQPHLQQRFSPLISSILVGFAWAFWHLPLWLTGVWDSNFVLYLLETVAFSIIIGWAFNNTDQSVFIASMFHYFVNFSVLIIDVATSLGMISIEGDALLSPIIYSLYAILVVIISILVKNSKIQDV